MILTKADLLAARKRVADDELADFNCPGFLEADGWDVSGDIFSCSYYVENPENPDADSIMGTFGLRFVPDTTEIVERWQ